MLAVILSGCAEGGALLSGWDPTAAPTATSGSQREFQARANGLCEEGLRRAERKALEVVRDKARLYIRNGTLNQYKGALRRQEISTMLAPALLWRMEKVRELPVPRGDGQRLDAILEMIEADGRAAEESAFYFLSSGSPMQQAHFFSTAYGIESCGILYRHGGLYEKGTDDPSVIP